MKLFIISKKTLYIISIIILCAIILGFIWNLSRTTDVFNTDIYYQGKVDEKIVALTCNIDWGNEYIDDMLNILKDSNIKITFFPTGRWAENNRDILLKIYREGHEIGNHGYKHLDYDKLDYKGNFEQINAAHSIIEEIIQDSPKYFAPPSGAFNESTIKAADDLGYKTILWSVDTIDWRKDSFKDIIVKRVIDNIHNSAIVLMHPTAETNKALPEIIEFLFKNGYKIGTISDIL
ncbi:MAG: polysaccharide deacetylase family protein [Tissierellaceae bacterium]|nr:polysaccharide deacetylase family protein [Tissierellaceae bacterium]